ncbi:Myxococcales GC_trans_RRR domain-containing protein [Lentzea fradiae]|uniref:Myxococcales GC_trans_RRR domain-containing protein n=1 Tax=Lentzea fradiae TaxID=200378 RepID=A0A1G7TQ86_9PSEU|nr:MYXO-CTERM sorting domain-containing protein [Lentzea fradiae]SDG37124.1 Myxococcales GC_trans_RRR domain-containing protein [Lentzea fradiae]
MTPRLAQSDLLMGDLALGAAGLLAVAGVIVVALLRRRR